MKWMFARFNPSFFMVKYLEGRLGLPCRRVVREGCGPGAATARLLPRLPAALPEQRSLCAARLLPLPGMGHHLQQCANIYQLFVLFPLFK
jgi:hypothetical protein